jgi:uncharacterized protein YutE (UPF0331/DUF86 family)
MIKVQNRNIKGDKPMTKDVLEIIQRKIRELEGNLLYLKQKSLNVNKDNIKNDIIVYWGIERGIQICIESVIDISNIVISVNDAKKPNTYRETVELIGTLGIIPKTFAKELSNMVGFRNILVHDYIKINEDIILEILSNNLDDFIKFSNYIRKYLDDNYK